MKLRRAGGSTRWLFNYGHFCQLINGVMKLLQYNKLTNQ